MRICDNGVYRDATAEEIAAFDNTPEPGSEDEDLSPDNALEIIMGGAG